MQTSPSLKKAALAGAALSLALAALAACSPKPSYTAQSASATPTLVTLTAALYQALGGGWWKRAELAKAQNAN